VLDEAINGVVLPIKDKLTVETEDGFVMTFLSMHKTFPIAMDSIRRIDVDKIAKEKRSKPKFRKRAKKKNERALLNLITLKNWLKTNMACPIMTS
jgi:hypothetical protein